MTDVLVLDQGPLFETGGSTSHAPGIIFQTNGSRTMCRIAQDSVALYDTLEVDGEKVWYGVGGIEVATTVERMEELQAPPGVRAGVRHRGHGAAVAGRVRRALAAAGPLDGARRLLGPERRRGQGRADRRGARVARPERGRRLRRGRDRHRVRHDRRPDPRGRDRAGACRVRARAPVRRHLGPDGRRDGGGADPAGRRAAPTGLDRPDPRAGGSRLARAAGRASPGHVAVLPSARGPFRRRQLPARADRDAAIAAPRAGRRDAALADALHPGGLRSVRDRRRRGCSRRWPAACARATRSAR